MSRHGAFVWYELMTPDREASRAFYGKLLGWKTTEMPMPGMSYTIVLAGEAPVGGMMDLTAEAKAQDIPPNWTGYVAVDDVDAAAENAKSLGATVRVGPQDIPEVGRFCVIADPQGAVIILFRTKNPADAPPQPAPGTPGYAGWHELMATDWEKALPFYNAMFGWQKSRGVDMGPMGTYQLFSEDGKDIGGMFNKPPNVPVACWLYYFNVENIDAAVVRLTAGGGTVLNGPMEVPGGAFIAQAKDPQGAMFAIVGPRA